MEVKEENNDVKKEKGENGNSERVKKRRRRKKKEKIRVRTISVEIELDPIGTKISQNYPLGDFIEILTKKLSSDYRIHETTTKLILDLEKTFVKEGEISLANEEENLENLGMARILKASLKKKNALCFELSTIGKKGKHMEILGIENRINELHDLCGAITKDIGLIQDENMSLIMSIENRENVIGKLKEKTFELVEGSKKSEEEKEKKKEIIKEVDGRSQKKEEEITDYEVKEANGPFSSVVIRRRRSKDLVDILKMKRLLRSMENEIEDLRDDTKAIERENLIDKKELTFHLKRMKRIYQKVKKKKAEEFKNLSSELRTDEKEIMERNRKELYEKYTLQKFRIKKEKERNKIDDAHASITEALNLEGPSSVSLPMIRRVKEEENGIRNKEKWMGKPMSNSF